MEELIVCADSGIISLEPYEDFVREFAMYAFENFLQSSLVDTDYDPSKKAGTPEWHQIFLRGIGCNWLVCLAVWVSPKGTLWSCRVD